MNETNLNLYFQYKYQINLDGTVAAYRFPYLMGGNSVVLKQDSPYYEHFYKSLEPGKHYIPFKRDLSDLREKILWAKSHDEEVIEFICIKLNFEKITNLFINILVLQLFYWFKSYVAVELKIIY